jgi:hypothetical protein
MKFSTLCIVNTIIAAVFGLGFALVPGSATSLYGVDLSAAGLFVARLLGTSLISFAVLSFLAKDLMKSGARRPVVMSMFVGDALGFIASLIAQLQGLFNAFGWSTVVIYLLLALGWGYFALIKKEE